MEFHWRWSQKCCCLVTDSIVAAFHLGSNNTACSLLLSTVAGTQVKPFKFVSRVYNMDGTCCLFYISLCSCQWSPLFRLLEATFVSPSANLLSFNTLSQTCRNLHGYSEGPVDFGSSTTLKFAIFYLTDFLPPQISDIFPVVKIRWGILLPCFPLLLMKWTHHSFEWNLPRWTLTEISY